MKMARRMALAGAALGLAVPGSAVALRHATSRPATGSAAGADVRVSRDSYSAHVEPSVAVDPRDPRHLLAASQLFGSGRHLIGTYASFDGGATWQDNGPLPAPPGTEVGDDVTVAFDQQGTGYVAAMMTTLSGGAYSQSNRGIYVWRTLNGGRTFQPPVAVVRHRFVDHPWLAVGLGHAGAVALYVVWVTSDHTGLGFASSHDSGRRFGAPRTISAPAGGVSTPVVAAGPNGSVYASFLTSPRGADPDGSLSRTRPGSRLTGSTASAADTAHADVVTSANGGRRFGPARVLASSPALLSPQPELAIPTGPGVAVDPRSGSAYVAFVADREGGATSDVVLARTVNRGRSWLEATTVASGGSAGQATYFQPQVAVDGSGGVDVSFLALSEAGVSVDLARSASDGASFAAPLTVTESPFTPSLGLHTGKTGAWWIGDYQGLAASRDVVHPLWSDTRTGRLEIFAASVPLTDLR